MEERLPIEVWCQIFKSLDNPTLMKCKLVCSDWYNLFAHDNAFKRIRTLSIRFSYLHPLDPHVIALTNSSTSFEKLILEGTQAEPNDNLESLWKNLGESVTELEVNGKGQTYIFETALIHFTKIKKLHFGILDYWASYLLEEWNENRKLLFSRIQSLSWNDPTFCINGSNAKMLFQLIPNLKDIHLPDHAFFFTSSYDFLFEHFEKIRSISYKPCTDSGTLHMNEHDQYEQKMNNIVKGLPNLKRCTIICINRLFYQQIKLIDKISYHINSKEYEKLNNLSAFTSLKSLNIMLRSGGCFIDHEEFKLPQLVELTLYSPRRICSVCLDFFFQSAKKLKHFNIETRSYNSLVHAISRHQHRFEQFELNFVAECQPNISFMQDFQSLTSLNLSLDQMPWTELISEKMWNFPKLERLVLKLRFISFSNQSNHPINQSNLPIQTIYEVIGKTLPWLKMVQLQVMSIYGIGFLSLEDLLHHSPASIEQITVDLSTSEDNNLEMVNKLVELFAKYPKLLVLYDWRYKSGAICSRADLEKYLADSNNQESVGTTNMIGNFDIRNV